MPVEAQPGSPLDTIRTKERELAHRLEIARRQADSQISHARTQTAESLAETEKFATAKAQSALDQAIAGAESDAETIRTQAQAAVLELKRSQQEQIGSLADAVVAWVLPSI